MEIGKDLKQLSIKTQSGQLIPQQLVPNVQDSVEVTNMDIEDMTTIDEWSEKESSSSSTLTNQSVIDCKVNNSSPNLELQSPSSPVLNNHDQKIVNHVHYNKTLEINNVPLSISFGALERIVLRHANIVSLDMPRTQNQIITLKLETVKQAMAVKQALQGLILDGQMVTINHKTMENRSINHTSSSSESDSSHLICLYCDEIFTSPEHLEKHSLAVHGALQPNMHMPQIPQTVTNSNVICGLCQNHFPSEDILNGHSLAVHGVRHNQPNSDAVCTLCKEHFPSELILQGHSLAVHGVLQNQIQESSRTPYPVSHVPTSITNPITPSDYFELNALHVCPSHRMDTWASNQRGCPFYLVSKNKDTGTTSRAEIQNGSVIFVTCGSFPEPQIAEGTMVVKNNTIVLSIRNSYGVNMTLYPHVPVPGITAHLLPFVREEVTKICPEIPHPLIANLPRWHFQVKRLKYDLWINKKTKASASRRIVRQGDPEHLNIDIVTDYRSPIILPKPKIVTDARNSQYGESFLQENPHAIRVTPATRSSLVLCLQCTEPMYCHCGCSTEKQ